MSDLPAASAQSAVAGYITASTTYYLSLHTADPGTTGASEVTGGSYARQAIVFTETGGVATSNAAITFAGMPAAAGNLWFGLWSAVTAGTYKHGSPTAGVTGPVAAGASVVVASGAVTDTVS